MSVSGGYCSEMSAQSVTRVVQTPLGSLLSCRDCKPHSASWTLAGADSAQTVGRADVQITSAGSLMPTHCKGTAEPVGLGFGEATSPPPKLRYSCCVSSSRLAPVS